MLWSVSIMIKPQRKFSSIPLGLICLWSFLGVFVHSFNIQEYSITRQYLNLYLMSEGFIYILMACMFIRLAVNYSHNLRFAWFIIPASALFYVDSYSWGGRITPLMALGIALLVYFGIKRQWGLVTGVTAVLGIFCVLNWHWIAVKFACRPLLWGAMIKDIISHPWVGMGFNKTLSFDNMHLIKNIGGVVYGWTYNHNDFLNLGAFLGIPALIFSLCFAGSMSRRTFHSVMIIPVIALILLCFFQMTMFEIGKASIILVMLSLIIIHTLKKGERYA
jgi:hypothetical protein